MIKLSQDVQLENLTVEATLATAPDDADVEICLDEAMTWSIVAAQPIHLQHRGKVYVVNPGDWKKLILFNSRET